MNIKNLFNSIFAYTPPVEYNFSLPVVTETTEANHNQISESEPEEKVSIFPSLNVNIEYMRTK